MRYYESIRKTIIAMLAVCKNYFFIFESDRSYETKWRTCVNNKVKVGFLLSFTNLIFLAFMRTLSF